jgi:hypothetical protein
MIPRLPASDHRPDPRCSDPGQFEKDSQSHPVQWVRCGQLVDGRSSVGGDHRGHDGAMTERPKHPSARRETLAGRDDVIDEQDRGVEIPPPTTAEPLLKRSHGPDDELIGHLPPRSTIGPRLRWPPPPGEPVPSSPTQRCGDFDRQKRGVIDATMPATPPVTRYRHDVRRPVGSVRGTGVPVVEPRCVGPQLIPESMPEPSPRIAVGTVLGDRECSNDLRRIRDEHRQRIDTRGWFRIAPDRPRHRRTERLVPPLRSRGRPPEPGITHRPDRVAGSIPKRHRDLASTTRPGGLHASFESLHVHAILVAPPSFPSRLQTRCFATPPSNSGGNPRERRNTDAPNTTPGPRDARARWFDAECGRHGARDDVRRLRTRPSSAARSAGCHRCGSSRPRRAYRHGRRRRTSSRCHRHDARRP